MRRILIDGRFIGVGDSMTRYTLEILKRLLAIDDQNRYTLLLRPQGIEVAKRFLKIANRKSQTLPTGRQVANNSQIKNSKSEKANKLTPNSYNLELEVLDIPHYSLSEQTKLLKYLNEKKFDLVHFVQFNHPIRYRGKFVVTIHDLTLLGHLYRMEYKKRFGFKIVMKSAIKNSAKILTISLTSKDDIVDHYKIDPNKIVVTHLAVDSMYNRQIANRKSQIAKFKEKYGIHDEYILYTGMWKKHKNLLRMLKGFEQVLANNSKLISDNHNSKLKNCHCEKSAVRLSRADAHCRGTTRQSIQLVLVGKIDKDEPEVMSEIDRINSAIAKLLNCQTAHKSLNNLTIQQFNNESLNQPKNKAVVATDFIDEADLPISYAGALAYCIPSLSEGFGLPPLEAMACGTPVISSNISAMPEILGDAPLYFDPYDIEDITAAMQKVIEDKNFREQLSKKGLEQVKHYNWQDTAKKTLEVYKNALNS